MSLELLPAFLMAVLACWLGLSLLVRAPGDRPTRAFAWLCFHLTLYGLTTLLPELTASPSARSSLQLVQVVETVLLPPVFLHFIIELVADGRVPPWQWATLGLFYAVGLAMAGYAIVFPDRMEALAGSLRFPDGAPLALWTAQRALPMLLALLLMFFSYRRAGGDDLERRRRALFALSSVVGVIGALWATAARNLERSPAIGHALMDAALALLAYAVLAYRSLLPARVAQRTFYRSLLGGALTAVYVTLLLVVEPAVNNALQLQGQFPLVSAFTLIVLIAVFGPLRDWAGAWLDRRFFHREFDYGRLLRALSDDLFQRGDLAGQLQAALASICRTLAVRDGAVAVQEGMGLRVLATYGVDRPPEEAWRGAVVPEAPQTHYGDWPPWAAARLLLPLRRGHEPLGLLALGVKESGEP